MSGKIIQFCDLQRARLYRQQCVPRGLAEQTPLELQVTRISLLLEELEELSGDRSFPLLQHARSTIERLKHGFVPEEDAELDGLEDSDPQPDVDRGLLERMYRDLNPYN